MLHIKVVHAENAIDVFRARNGVADGEKIASWIRDAFVKITVTVGDQVAHFGRDFMRPPSSEAPDLDSVPPTLRTGEAPRS